MLRSPSIAALLLVAPVSTGLAIQVRDSSLRIAENAALRCINDATGDSTGCKVWDSGRALSSILEGMELSGKTVLELGSGTGVGGLTAATCGASVLLTDGAASMVSLLEQNVATNRDVVQQSVRGVYRLRWGDEDEVAAVADCVQSPFDLIIGSDLLYAPETFPVLLETLTELCTPGHTEVLFTYPTRYTEGIFFEQAASHFDELASVEEVQPCIFASRLVLREE